MYSVSSLPNLYWTHFWHDLNNYLLHTLSLFHVKAPFICSSRNLITCESEVSSLIVDKPFSLVNFPPKDHPHVSNVIAGGNQSSAGRIPVMYGRVKLDNTLLTCHLNVALIR